MLLEGKRALVTGSTRGIGHATARRFLAEGAEVIVHGRGAETVARVVGELAGGGRCSGVAGDLARREDVQRLAERAGEIDILVNSAGIYEERSIEEVGDADWDRLIEVNVTAPWLLAKAMLPGLKRRGGVIVNVGSDSGLLGYPRNSVYCASKGAIIGLTRALAVEMAPAVRALCVCPGPIDTDMMRDAVAAAPDPLAAGESWESYPLLRRIGKPEEIAAAILFAASPECTFTTGSLVVVDGGATAGKRI